MSLLGTTIGRIRLTDLLGKGGMGEVFVGYDETLDRKVAVKCVRVSGPKDGKHKRRFLQEARILSRLDHPNICQIYDFVEGDGLDYLVMELVEGKSLQGTSNLDEKTKLEVAQRVAEVLVAAHAEGVVHRDLKPEHVMITPEGVVKVLDFGIAHSVVVEEADIDRTLDLSSPAARAQAVAQTVAGSVVGTPRYMSPEQARGEPVTPASDMYTFGLLLQELFTGEKPYPRQSLDKLLLAVGEGRSRPVRGLGHVLTELIEDLQALKPGDRPTAKETADRLRFIRETPKRRLKRGAAAAALLLVLGGIAKYTIDLRHERELALAAKNEAVAARDQAEDLVTFMLEDLSAELRPSGRLEVLEKVARKALDYYERVGAESVGAPAFRRGQAFRLVAEVLDDQGDLEEAHEAALTARQIRQRLVDGSPTRLDWRNELAYDHVVIGGILRQKGARPEALAELEAGRNAALELLAEDPSCIDCKRTLGEANYGLGMYHLWTDPEAADGIFREAIAIYRQLAASEPENLSYLFRMAVMNGQGLGQAYRQRGMDEKSFAAVQEAYALYEKLTVADPSNTKWQHGFAWENRRSGHYKELQESWDEALAYHSRAKEITERLLSVEPSQAEWQQGLATDFSAIGWVLHRRGDLEAALEPYRQAIDISHRLTASDPTRRHFRIGLASSYLAVADVYVDLGRRREAKEAWESALEVTADSIHKEPEPDGDAVEMHAYALLRLERIDEAKPLVEMLVERNWIEGRHGRRRIRRALPAPRSNLLDPWISSAGSRG